MKTKESIVLLNSEGAVLTAKKENDKFLLFDSSNNLLEELTQKEFIDVVYNKRPVTFTDGEVIVYTNTPITMRANRGELTRFTYGEGVKTHFVEFDKTDGQWLSPVPSEREWQEEALQFIFGHYPNASPRWQYLNGLIHIALENIPGGDGLAKTLEKLNTNK